MDGSVASNGARRGESLCSQQAVPNQQPTLNRLASELRCRNFVAKRRLSMQVGAKTRAKTCTQRVHIPTELPLCLPPLVVGYLLLYMLKGLAQRLCSHGASIRCQYHGYTTIKSTTVHETFLVSMRP